MITADLTDLEVEPLQDIGYSPEHLHAGTCVIVDDDVRRISVFEDGVEILPISDALQRYSWIRDLTGSELSPELHGYFIWVHEGVELTKPLQAFTLLATPGHAQSVHNVTVIDRNAKVEMLSGTTVGPFVTEGRHSPIRETHVREGARCISVSITHGSAGMTFESQARAHVGVDGLLAETSIALSGLRRYRSARTSVVGRNGTANDQTIVFAPTGTRREIDSLTRLVGAGASAASVVRMVSDGGDIVNRAELIGDAHAVRGYLGCGGLKLSDHGQLEFSPVLRAATADAQLSHNASIGMAGQDNLTYLMATGMSEEDARELIVQGFLDLDNRGIPRVFRDQVDAMIAIAKSGAMQMASRQPRSPRQPHSLD
ncbi:SufD family Fe-S cluster assembly protein [Mycobacterium sp. CVI_P3]|uniref:SufD family Fe-S cluster assembly protein n=1 Tax=Mycobacterium pinniadriaticum TaxID=2994102 RepID=A0ABT3SG24_9MYCO|nr:SufD family Fe-S cluster assembly protein [Mycobacterium pinniadriaticum]MCX2932040.1 SufD family Fe-S cluster assembly protein [Mycobacterium pinniadriaticum]MCX2938464.1 SufD family Fe-S cluster assembly protein [Mycobacterium pinniadriaticum]